MKVKSASLNHPFKQKLESSGTLVKIEFLGPSSGLIKLSSLEIIVFCHQLLISTSFCIDYTSALSVYIHFLSCAFHSLVGIVVFVFYIMLDYF